jgi:hypothetical protein
VLLWTTSRDDEITTKASQANGILLKKTINWPDLAQAVDAWLPEGRAKRISLPSAFFNHTLRRDDYRQLVWDCTDWCLKQLDSFHALDGSYFRFFTDHGGRHIIKLLELLAQSLQPFLGASDERVLASDPAKREFELLSLYLAVVFHELGMFPMKVGGHVEDFASLTSDYLDDVRSLHAPRGMALLHDAEGSFWNDDQGRALGARLGSVLRPGSSVGSLRDSIAVLVGYHARFFPSLEAGLFLSWVPSKRFENLRAPVAFLARTENVFKVALEELKKTLVEDASGYERLRRQCALFRFVDAMDIAGSRNPALFLIHNPKRGAENNREYLKRQVCASVEIKSGQVIAQMRALPPVAEKVLAALSAAQQFKLVRRKVAEADLQAAGVAGSLPELCEPWALMREVHGLSPTERKKRLAGSVRVLQKPLDAWLSETWKVIMGNGGSYPFTRHLEDLGVIETGQLAPRATREGKELIASLSALSVAGEILDEYEAMIEADLDRSISLKEFLWADMTSWHEGPPIELTILKEGLRQYQGDCSP